MEISYWFLTRLIVLKGLNDIEISRKIQVYNECLIPFEVLVEVRNKGKVDYYNLKIC